MNAIGKAHTTVIGGADRSWVNLQKASAKEPVVIPVISLREGLAHPEYPLHRFLVPKVGLEASAHGLIRERLEGLSVSCVPE